MKNEGNQKIIRLNNKEQSKLKLLYMIEIKTYIKTIF